MPRSLHVLRLSLDREFLASSSLAAATSDLDMWTSKKGLGPPDQARISQALQDFEKTLAVYDDILSRQKYLAGDNLTIADLFHLPQGAAMEAFGHKEVLQRYRHVTKWFDSLQARKSWA